MSDEELIQEETQGPLKTTLIVGAILGVFMIIYNNLVVYGSNPELSEILQYISYFIILCFALAAIKIHRDKNLGGNITYGQAFLTSFLTILWFSLIMAAFAYFYFKFNPEKIDEVVHERLKYFEKLVDKGEITDEDFENRKKGIEMMSSPIGMALGLFMVSFFLGLIVSLIATAFHKLIPKKA